VIYLTLDELRRVAERVVPSGMEIRDLGLLEAAVARPRTSALGQDAYPSIHHKAAALLHSIARNHALVDGNKRLSLAAVIAFYGMNGLRLTMSNERAFEFVIDVSTGQIDDIGQLADVLSDATEPR
jgi:death-on-curing protein